MDNQQAIFYIDLNDYKVGPFYGIWYSLIRLKYLERDGRNVVHRDESSNLCIKFGQDGEVLTGARPEHLANKDIIVAERNEDGTFTSHWERIYPSLKK